MSLPGIATESTPPIKTSLLIDESPYQFLPSLGQIFGDTEALILQQLHYVLQKPYFDDERLLTATFEARQWVKIEMWMWWDELDGFCKHIPQRTFERKKSDLEKEGVILTTDRLNTDTDDKTRWFTLNYELLHEKENAHRISMQAKREKRENERRALYEMFGPKKKWRPNIRIPGMAEPSRHFGGRVPPNTSAAKTADVVPPKRRLRSRQNGARTTAKTAASAYSTENDEKAIKNNNTQQSAVAPDDVVVENELRSESEESQSGILGTLPKANDPVLQTANATALAADPIQREIVEGKPPLPGTNIEAAKEPNLLARLIAAGVAEKDMRSKDEEGRLVWLPGARKLAATVPEICEQQLAWQAARLAEIEARGEPVRNPGAVLASAIRHVLPEPTSLRIKRETASLAASPPQATPQAAPAPRREPSPEMIELRAQAARAALASLDEKQRAFRLQQAEIEKRPIEEIVIQYEDYYFVRELRKLQKQKAA